MRPASERELTGLLRDGDGALSIRGGGTQGYAAVAGEPVETSGLSGIRLYEPGALTLIAGAGTPLAEIEAALAGEGQFLPFEPPRLGAVLGTTGKPTIGGVVASNLSGPRRIVAGAARDALIGVRFVDGAGRVVRNGGRVMKNVTGYDLVKLMAGSFGTLGVLTEVAFKLLPRPRTEASVVIEGLEPAAAVAALSAALGTPYGVTGAARLPAKGGEAARTALRIEGFSDSVAYRAGALARALKAHGPAGVEADAGVSAAIWRRVAGVEDFAGAPGDVWRVTVRPTDAPGLVARADCPAVLDWGGGLIWFLAPVGADLRARLGPGIAATRMRGAPEPSIPVFTPPAPPVAELARALRAKFDPMGRLNRGLMD